MVIVHNLNRHTVISLIDGNSHIVLADSGIIREPSKLSYPLEGFRIKAGLLQTKITALGSDEELARPVNLFKNGFLGFNGSRFAVVSRKFGKPQKEKSIRVDYVILTENTLLKAHELSDYFPGAEFIADASNSYWRIQQWKTDFEELGVMFYDVREQGARIIRDDRVVAEK